MFLNLACGQVGEKNEGKESKSPFLDYGSPHF